MITRQAVVFSKLIDLDSFVSYDANSQISIGPLEFSGDYKSMGDYAFKVLKHGGCLACHAMTKKIVGPSWKAIADRYRNTPEARDELIQKVKRGGKGRWNDLTGGVPMPPYSPRVSDDDIRLLVDKILAIK